jgi:hypothetical protein
LFSRGKTVDNLVHKPGMRRAECAIAAWSAGAVQQALIHTTPAQRFIHRFSPIPVNGLAVMAIALAAT